MSSSIRTTLIKRITTIIVIIFIVVLSSIALVTVYTTNTYLDNSEQQLFQAMSTKGHTLAVNNSQALIDMVSDNSFSSVRNLVLATVKNDSDIVYGIFMDAEQRPWVISNDQRSAKNKIETETGTEIEIKIELQLYSEKLQDGLSLWAAALTQTSYRQLDIDKMPAYTGIKDAITIYEFAAPVFLPSEDGEPQVLLGTIRYGISTKRMEVARIEVQNFSRQVLIITLLMLFALGLIAILVAYFATRHTATLITQPLAELSLATRKISQGHYDSAIVMTQDAHSDNEIGVLSRSFDTMRLKIKDVLSQLLQHQQELKVLNQNLEDKVIERTAELKAVQRELLESARAAGMAEVAVNVLHNIGNVINSVNIANQDSFGLLKNSRLPTLLKTNHLIQDNLEHLSEYINDDPQGKKLPELFNLLCQSLNKDNQLLMENSSRMMQSINIIGNIIATQQKYAKSNLYNESLGLQAVVEDSLDVLDMSFANHDIVVQTHFSEQPNIMVDNAKLHQILSNVLLNAKHSVLNNSMDNRLLEVSLFQEQGFAVLTIKDNGTGIKPELLTDIFQHGFTTKKEGHGFGLHSCANLLGEMGGSIEVVSEGEGKGACFIIKLPFVDSEEGL
ncbi:sensor histidine kinase [sulfur-oxidizing endosymbiont of Gigantopelta aegis]|uniref:sensor histidine kinase n=1 Tax=sulfur-oxidizing endosymbiont of Gigantopelta aegis TaxID=2794934 RepID=UPI0018DC58F1|nr:ATP-binding protein [sulfur-oxidizing endosymbiont of Gigantopelta aegis]